MRQARAAGRNNLSFAGSVFEQFAVRPSDCPSGQPHHWRYEEPNGNKKVTGTCRHCGGTREDWTAGDPNADWLSASERAS